MWRCLALVIVIIIILFVIFPSAENYRNADTKTTPHIKLYEGFGGKNLIFDFEPVLSDPTSLFLRKQVKANIKSFHFKGNPFLILRTIFHNKHFLFLTPICNLFYVKIKCKLWFSIVAKKIHYNSAFILCNIIVFL